MSIASVLPYQELLGNYNTGLALQTKSAVLPYQELLGNYNIGKSFVVRIPVLPYQELLGNYNSLVIDCFKRAGFTIPRTAKRLQQWVN